MNLWNLLKFIKIQSTENYGSPFMTCKIFVLIRFYELVLLIRKYQLVIRKYETLIRIYELVFRKYELVIRIYEIVFRKYELLIRKNELVKKVACHKWASVENR